MQPPVLFVWDNFGPLHADRCAAAARLLGPARRVIGIQLFADSKDYDWAAPAISEFELRTLFPDGGWGTIGVLRLASAIVRMASQCGARAVFMSHYERPAMLLAASWLRLRGVRVVTMGCSKRDDAARMRVREWVKRAFYWPYFGGIGSADRSLAYMRELGLPAQRVLGGYNTVDQERIRRLARTQCATPVAFSERPFLAVARLIPQKNLAGLLKAYAGYRSLVSHPRRLVIAGSGPLEQRLQAQAATLGIQNWVDWLGFVQTEAIAPLMRDALCLCLPSISETFGNVVPEALALGLPVLASTQCGATDRLVQDGVSGLTFARGDDGALEACMVRIDQDRSLWENLKAGALDRAPLGDTVHFARSVERLVSEP